MDLSQTLPTFSKIKFSIVHLLIATTGIAFFLAVLFNENEWLLATYSTLLLGILLNECVTAVCARGERQYFSLGFICCFPIYYVSVFAYIATLPYLITVRSYEILEGLSVDLPSDEHYVAVMSSFWVLLTSYTLGRVGQYWYRRRQREAASGEISEASPVKP